MQRILGLIVLAACLLPSLDAAGPIAAKKAKPKVEVVFVLDTTGSMSGLIDGAKAKIWAICNQIAGGNPTPDLKVGLVAYRDKGDTYVTKVFDLSDDLDAIHGHLKGFKAEGGGDLPEDVNQALHDAVHKIQWSEDTKTLRIIFLVGDAPPHMDYKQVQFPETCQAAVKRGIIINTIQCGKNADCTKYWKDIAAKSEGSYAAIEQGGGVVVITTPFDKDLAKLNTELAGTVVVYGDGRQQRMAEARRDESTKLEAASAAERVAFQAKNSQAAAYCLLDAVNSGKVKLDQLKKEEFPPELQKLSDAERKEHFAKLTKQRAELNKQVLDLDRKRSDYITNKRAEDAKKGQAGFDGQVLDMLRNQAKKANIKY